MVKFSKRPTIDGLKESVYEILHELEREADIEADIEADMRNCFTESDAECDELKLSW